jgi:hypothetical protein
MELFFIELALTVTFAIVWAIATAFYVILPISFMYFVYRLIRMVKNGY